MAQGERFAGAIQKFADQRTGREIWKISPWDHCHCAATYFYFQAFSPDERYVVIASDRTGLFEIYRVDLASGEVVQLSQRKASAQNNPKGLIRCHIPQGSNEVFYVDGSELWACHLETLQTRRVLGAVDNPEWVKQGWSCVMSRDGRQVIGSFLAGDGRQGLMACDLASGQSRELFRMPDTTLALGHTLVAPSPTLQVSFNIAPDKQNDPQQSHARRARCWGWDEAGRQIAPLLVMPVGFRATHEHFGQLPSGEPRLFAHKKTVPTWTPASLASVNLKGEDLQEHYVSDRKLGHSCASPDGRFLVTDVQDAGGNELILVDLISGQSEVLCWPDSTVADGVTGHVHPSVSPSGKKVLYTSDKAGKAAAFVVPLA